MHVVIAKVNETYFDGEADSITVPGAEGEMTVLQGHEPLVTTLKRGTIVVRSQIIPDGQQFFEIESGVLEVHADGATIIL